MQRKVTDQTRVVAGHVGGDTEGHLYWNFKRRRGLGTRGFG